MGVVFEEEEGEPGTGREEEEEEEAGVAEAGPAAAPPAPGQRLPDLVEVGGGLVHVPVPVAAAAAALPAPAAPLPSHLDGRLPVPFDVHPNLDRLPSLPCQIHPVSTGYQALSRRNIASNRGTGPRHGVGTASKGR